MLKLNNFIQKTKSYKGKRKLKKKVLIGLLFLFMLFVSLSAKNETVVNESQINFDESQAVELKNKSMSSVLSYCDDLSFGLGLFEPSYGSGGGGAGGSTFESSVAGAIGTALAGAALYGATSQGATSGTSIVVYPTWTSSSNAISNSSSKSEIQKFVKSFLEKEDNKYGWTEDELKEALSQSMNVAKNGEFLKVDKYPDEQFKVYLGIFTNADDSYEKVAKKNEGSACFSMDNDVWDLYYDNHKDGMWILNKLFLEYVISKNCIFVLVNDPKDYFIEGSILQDKFYSKELEHIWNRGYLWDSKYSYDMMEVARKIK